MDRRDDRFKRYSLFALILLLMFGAVSSLRTPTPHVPEPRTLSSLSQASLPVLDNTKKEDAFSAFNEWMSQNVSSDKAQPLSTAEIQRGIELAKTRRIELLALIESDPKTALDKALTDAQAARLPQEIRALVEERISANGELSAIATLPDSSVALPQVKRYARVGDKTYRAHVYGRRTAQKFVPNAVLNGIALGDQLALDENPARMVKLADVADREAVLAAAATEACPVSLEAALKNNDLTLAIVAGRTIYLCRQGHFYEVNAEVAAQEGAGTVGGEIAQSAQSVGNKTLLFIRVDFSDLTGEPVSEAAALALINSDCNTFFTANSYGVTTLDGTVTPVLRMPQTSNYYKTTSGGDVTLLTDARNAATAAGFTNANYNLDIVAFKNVFPGWAGQGYVGWKGTWLNGYFDLRVTAHELGHNFGLWHANYWQTTDGTAIGTGSNNEYGDIFDMLGSSSTTQNHHLNTYEKNILDWLPNANVNTVTASGTYRVYQHDTNTLDSNFKYALKLNRDGSRNYWMELRQKLTGNAWLMNGLGLRWGAWSSSNNGSQLLDTTPGSADGKNDSAIVLGRTFSDVSAGIHITPISKNSTTPVSMDVVINLGSFSTNQSPTVAVSSSAQFVGVNTSVTFTATASDPDSDTLAYHWTFSDSTAPNNSNSASVSRSFSTTGIRTVTCTVSDMKGRTASASAQVNVTATPPDQEFNVTAFTATGSETGTPAVFRITRTGTTTGSITISYQVSGTATAGTDYTALPGTLLFGANVTSLDVSVAPINDTGFEGDETVKLTLSGTSTYTAGSNNEATVTISDDDTPTMISALAANPNPAVAKKTVQFTCASNIPDATYAWTYGDGTTQTGGASIGKTYNAGGNYTVVVRATHPASGNYVESTLSLNVTEPPPVLPINKFSGGFRLDSSGGDSCSMAFNVPAIKPGYLPEGKSVMVTVGGATQAFTLGKSGSGRNGSSSCSLKVSKGTTTTTLTVSMKGAFVNTWASNGVNFNVTGKNLSREMPVAVTVDGTTYNMNVRVLFSATAGKRGTFKR